jgi:hypothetical protein
MSGRLALERGPAGERIRPPGPMPIGWPPCRLASGTLVVISILGRGLAAACLVAVLAALLAASAGAARAQPVVLRLGYGGAAE